MHNRNGNFLKKISIIIRTLNEEKYLGELLEKIKSQQIQGYIIQIVLVDSGSTDSTIIIAKKFNAKLLFIKKNDFSFGRSLNIGCKHSDGDILVFISGHCIPKSNQWLTNLINPIAKGICKYTYGKQLGRDTTKFSEKELFKKLYPDNDKIPQDGFFCNNANAAIDRKVWEHYKFDEELSGCEDMELAKRMWLDGEMVGYVSRAEVYHIHNEQWGTLLKRYERESLALQKIMPEINLSIYDVITYTLIGIISDLRQAIKEKVVLHEFFSIILFRYYQYKGSYRGNKINRDSSNKLKTEYFYPISKK